MLSVYDEELNIFGFEQIHDRFPKNAGALHRHVGAVVFLDPVDQLEKIDGVASKRLDLLSFGRNDAGCDALLVNIQTACSFNKNIHDG